MYEGDISDVLVLNGVLPHVVVMQAIQLRTGILDFASSDIIYSFRYMQHSVSFVCVLSLLVRGLCSLPTTGSDGEIVLHFTVAISSFA